MFKQKIKKGMYFLYVCNIFTRKTFSLKESTLSSTNHYFSDKFVGFEIQGSNVFDANWFNVVYNKTKITNLQSIYSSNNYNLCDVYSVSNYINKYCKETPNFYNLRKFWYSCRYNEETAIKLLNNDILQRSYFKTHKRHCNSCYTDEIIYDGLVIVLNKRMFGLNSVRRNSSNRKYSLRTIYLELYNNNYERLGSTTSIYY